MLILYGHIHQCWASMTPYTNFDHIYDPIHHCWPSMNPFTTVDPLWPHTPTLTLCDSIHQCWPFMTPYTDVDHNPIHQCWPSMTPYTNVDFLWPHTPTLTLYDPIHRRWPYMTPCIFCPSSHLPERLDNGTVPRELLLCFHTHRDLQWCQDVLSEFRGWFAYAYREQTKRRYAPGVWRYVSNMYIIPLNKTVKSLWVFFVNGAWGFVAQLQNSLLFKIFILVFIVLLSIFSSH